MKHKTKKIITSISVVIVVLVILVIAFISPISKYLIEKYSEPLLGRKIRLSWAYVNPFTGHVGLHGVKIYEYQSDSIFFSANSISANYSILKTLKKTYEISSLTLDEPHAVIIQDHDYFNFEDLIKKFTPKGPPDTTKGPTKFNLLDVEIKNGQFRYVERSAKVDYYIKNVRIKTPGMRWDKDTINAEYYIENGPSTGTIKGAAGFNLKTINYSFSAVVKNFDLQIIEQYLRDIANYGSFTAKLDADVHGTGSLQDSLGINVGGFTQVRDFHFGKAPGDDFLSFERAAVQMTQVDPQHYKYIIDSMMVQHPYFKYERYDHLDNLQKMFGEGGSNYTATKEDETKFNLIVEIAKYMRELAKNFLKSYYKIDKVAIYQADIRFNDFSLRDEFSAGVSPLYFLADSIDKNNRWFSLSVRSGVKPYGDLGIDVKINPQNYSNFMIDYKLQKVALAAFNPYVVTYTSFPLDRGTMEANGNWSVKDSIIESTNHLLIIDPRHGKRVKKKDTKWIPVPLILSIVRAPGSVIDYTIPIKGNLNHPKYVFKYVIADVLRNIFVKPPLTPYLVHVSDVEQKVEKFQTLKWEMRQTQLNQKQEKFIGAIAEFIDKTPDATVTISPLVFADKEKENVLFFEAKKKYFFHNRQDKTLSEKDSLMLDKMSVKDSGFIAYLNTRIKDTMMYTVQEKCISLVGEAVVNKGYANLNKARENIFLSYFKNADNMKRVKIKATEADVPFNGFSYYKIEYQGELPHNLVKAYEQLNNIDNEDPRANHKEDRKKNRDVLKPDM